MPTKSVVISTSQSSQAYKPLGYIVFPKYIAVPQQIDPLTEFHGNILV